MTNEELNQVIGGAVSYTSAAFLNAISRGIGVCYDIGKACGTALRMLISKQKCQ